MRLQSDHAQRCHALDQGVAPTKQESDFQFRRAVIQFLLEPKQRTVHGLQLQAPLQQPEPHHVRNH